MRPLSVSALCHIGGAGPLCDADVKAIACDIARSRAALCGGDCRAPDEPAEATIANFVTQLTPQHAPKEKPHRCEPLRRLGGDAEWITIEEQDDLEDQDLPAALLPVLDPAPRKGIFPAELFVERVAMPKRTTPLSLNCDMLNGALRINRVPERGIFARFNAKAQRQIQQGDFIMAVGGAPISSKSFTIGGALELTMLRPHRLVAQLPEKEGPLGLDIASTASSTALYVVGIRPRGRVHAHGAECPASELRHGDIIVAVNGVGGDAPALERGLKACGALELIIDRICDAEDASECSVCRGARRMCPAGAPAPVLPPSGCTFAGPPAVTFVAGSPPSGEGAPAIADAAALPGDGGAAAALLKAESLQRQEVAGTAGGNPV